LNFANLYTYIILFLIVAIAIIIGQLDRWQLWKLYQ
jgi:hypothetical protein